MLPQTRLPLRWFVSFFLEEFVETLYLQSK
jgi:hypothetical protein